MKGSTVSLANVACQTVRTVRLCQSVALKLYALQIGTLEGILCIGYSGFAMLLLHHPPAT